MHIILQFLNNHVEKFNINKVNNENTFLETNDFKNKSLIISKKINKTRIYNPLIIYLMNDNKLIDKKYISRNNLDLSLYLDLIEFFRHEIFNEHIDFKSKKYSYRFYIDEEKTKNDHILTIRNIVIKKRNKKTCINTIKSKL